MKSSPQSVTIANTYKKNEGVTRAARLYLKAFEDLGYDVSPFQLTYGDDIYYYTDHPIQGLKLPFKKFAKAFNILFVFPKLAGKSQSDILVLSDPWLLRSSKYRNSVIVIFHDIRQLTAYKDGIMASMLFRIMLLYLKKVDFVICVSETCKTELLKRKLIDKEKIYVIKNSLFPAQTGKESNLTNYEVKSLNHSKSESFNILYVAADQKHKNIDFYMSLASSIIRKYEGKFIFYLVSKMCEERVPNYLRNKNLNFILTHDVKDMDALYSEMDLLLFPSSYEGFGFPLIEAMSHGLPVIALNIPATKEVMGHSGILLDKLDIESWEVALLKVFDERSYTIYSRQAFDQAKLYDYSSFKDGLSNFLSYNVCKLHKTK